jgi:hypothetical protein
LKRKIKFKKESKSKIKNQEYGFNDEIKNKLKFDKRAKNQT